MPLILLGIFLLFALLFAYFRQPIGRFNRTVLLLTDEIRVYESKSSEAKVLEKEIVRAKTAKKLVKTKWKQPPKKPQKLHGGRTEPAREGFYLDSSVSRDEVPDDAKMYLTQKKQVVYQPENWEGKQDCAAVGWIRKTDEGIVATVEVRDDCLEGFASSPWQNDSVEFYFDFRPADSRGKDVYEKGAFQAIAVPCFAEKGANKVSFYFGGGSPLPVPGTRMKSWIDKGKGYGVSVLFPYEGLKKYHLMPGEEFNFDIAINDSDNKGKRSQMMWSGTVSNCRGPKFFGRLKPYSKKQK